MNASQRARRIGVLGAALLLAACSGAGARLRTAGDAPLTSAHAAHPVATSTPEMPPHANLEAIRLATERFADIEVAKREGWSEMLTPCMEGEAGGQGFHYGNPELIGDQAQLDMYWPELLMYEPRPGGEMALVGVEYIIPTADWTRPEPPSILGLPMHVNPKFGVWVLHVWLTDNPSGVYADWNPGVSCAHAG